MKNRAYLLIAILFSLMLVSPCFAQDAPFPLLYSPGAKVAIDGNLSDWPQILPFICDSDSQVKRGKRASYDDLNGMVWCFFDAENLYVAANVTDPTPMLNKNIGTNIWQADSVEGYIGFFRDEKKNSYGGADFQYGITLTPDTQLSFCWQKNSGLKDIASFVVKTEKGCILEARIPLKNFNLKKAIAPGDPMWIDFAINQSANGMSRDYQLAYWGDGEGWSDPGVWRKAVIADSRAMLAPQIISRLSVEPKLSHNIYIYSKAKPWAGDVTLGDKKIKTDSRGGITVKSDEEKSFALAATIDGKQLKANVKVEVDRSREIIAMPVKRIKVNQLGYHPKEKKTFVATITGAKLRSKTFKVIDTKTNEAVLSGEVSAPAVDPSSKDEIVTGDFTALKLPGKYTIKLEGAGESYEFKVANTVFSDLFYTTMRHYYLQRCGIKVSDPVTKLEYGPCHTKDAYMRDDEKTLVDVSGGWHDAGDYGKYMPTAGITVAQLLMLYELNPEGYAGFSLDIPESKNKIPDILDEVKYELDWMLKMQDKDGGVFHKINTKVFPKTIAPEDDTEEVTGERRYLYDKGLTDTGMFCGAVAVAARVFAGVDATYAKKLKNAAIASAEFILVLNKENRILSPFNDSTGSYLSGEMHDEQFWAFAEVYRLTGEEKYLAAARGHFVNTKTPVPSWENPQTLAIFTLCASAKLPGDFRKELLALLTAETARIVEKSKANGYRQALYNTEYIWASNKIALSYGEMLILMYQYTKSKEYLEVAKRQIDYVLGVNPLSKSYLTGLGTDSVKYPHHRVVQSKSLMIPGLLVGGPNNDANDGKYAKKLGPKGYVDNWEAWSCNEYAIDYNAPLVFLAGYFMNLEDKELLK